MTEDRRESLLLRKVFDLWPLWLTLAGGVVAGIKFYFTVNDIVASQARWQAMTDQRRDKNRDDIEALRLMQARQSVEIEWLKQGRKHE